MNIKKLIQPNDFDHLCEWWMIEREKKGNFTALRILEKQYPQYARQLSEWVLGFIDFEHIINEPSELSAEEEAELNEIAARSVRKILDKFNEDTRTAGGLV